MHIIGIDHGNSMVKTTRFCFSNSLGTDSAEPALVDEWIKYQGRYYSLAGGRVPYQRDKTQDSLFFVLTLLAIAKEVEARKIYQSVIDLQIAAGLPVLHYGALKDKFANYLTNNGNRVRFEYNGKPYVVQITKAHIIPQGYAALASEPELIDKLPSCCVVDIGGYTVDTIRLERVKKRLIPIKEFNNSFEAGVNKAFNEVRKYFSTTVGGNATDELILDILAGKNELCPMETRGEVKKIVCGHAKTILNTLIDSGIDIANFPVVFVGGGAALLKEAIINSRMVTKSYFIEDPRVNAKGFESLAGKMQSRQEG